MEEKKLDFNSVIGFVLLGVIMIWYVYDSKPTTTENQAKERPTNTVATTKIVPAVPVNSQKDSISVADSRAVKPLLAKDIIVENKVLKLVFSTQGGYLKEALLKKYTDYQGQPLYLIKDGNASLNMSFATQQGRVMNTQAMLFESALKKVGDDQMLTLQLNTAPNAFIAYRYTIKPNDYMLGFEVYSKNMDGILDTAKKLDLTWTLIGNRLEKSAKYENQYTALHYEKEAGKYDDLSVGGTDEETEKEVNWVGFKQHFFSNILISKAGFEMAQLRSKTLYQDETSLQTKSFELKAPLDYSNGNIAQQFDYYIGPNDFTHLQSYDKGIENIISLGWGIFGWINRNAFIPLFDFLGGFIGNYGLIIILMTIVVRLFMSPLVYKSYLSSAKMKVLRPEMEAINNKYPGKENAMKRQQEVMALQRKSGVSMLSGCIPALLQMPVFFALFMFFPSAIDLRQQGFLWASDLSSYDSVYQLPFSIPFYGDHVSLFPILASVAIFFYMRMSQGQQMSMQQPTQEGMPDMKKMMKMMMYFSPVMMLLFFNSYGAGLSLYYFISNVLTLTIMFVIKKFIIDEDKIHAQIQENQKRPDKPKSKFRQRMELAMKEAEAQRQKQKR